MKMVSDAGFEPTTSTVGAQKERRAENITCNLCKDMIEKVLECIDITKATEEGLICCVNKKNDILKKIIL